ncbi:D-threo-aldose 1-dehydrogenase [Knoellia remsis]|uniref:D-threo-aldose 1-dehydrogenase n=1 Tax=Knoellia remsis TaxID=407159 RepID=A0A2T0U4L0_9MICO|nr:aldo/keto reductase [Knoellia remsis]PRY52865.1 D-threo-aldose 1-dehydrogenase [Knoellia remsis]
MTLAPSSATPVLALGVAQLGNLFHEVSDADARAVLESAWEAGIRTFDTAPHYGLGLSERRLGAFLGSLDAPERAEALVSTKVGRLLRPTPGRSGDDLDSGFAVPATHERVWDATAAGIRTSLESSLIRLGLDRVDTTYLHDPDEYPDPEGSIRGGLAALDELRREGLTRVIGTGSKSVAALADSVADERCTALMVAGRWTVIDRSAGAEVLPRAADRGVEVAAAGVYNSGLLATARPSGHFEYAAASPAVVALAERVAGVCESHGVDLPTAALHFAARGEGVTRVVVGARSVEQVRQTLERWNTTVPDALWEDLADAGDVSSLAGTERVSS